MGVLRKDNFECLRPSNMAALFSAAFLQHVEEFKTEAWERSHFPRRTFLLFAPKANLFLAT